MAEPASQRRVSAPRQPVDADRRALYGKLQIARKALGLLDDDMWRDLLQGRYGKTSRTDLSRAELVDLVEYFKAQGFKPTKPGRAGKRPLAGGEEARKIRALWLTLWNLGVVREPSEEALAAFVKRVTGGRERGVEALQWLRDDQAMKAIEALKAWAARPVENGGGGVDWSAFESPIGRVWHDPRRRVIEAQLRIMAAAGDPADMPHMPTEEEKDRVIAAFGGCVRLARGAPS